MNKLLIVGAGMGLVLAAGVAVAQAPAPGAPPPPPPPGEMRPEMGRPEMGRPEMGMRGIMHGMHRPPPPSKAAHFHFRKGDARVDIKCADDEPMKACVDAASTLMDKLAAQPK